MHLVYSMHTYADRSIWRLVTGGNYQERYLHNPCGVRTRMERLAERRSESHQSNHRFKTIQTVQHALQAVEEHTTGAGDWWCLPNERRFDGSTFFYVQATMAKKDPGLRTLLQGHFAQYLLQPNKGLAGDVQRWLINFSILLGCPFVFFLPDWLVGHGLDGYLCSPHSLKFISSDFAKVKLLPVVFRLAVCTLWAALWFCVTHSVGQRMGGMQLAYAELWYPVMFYAWASVWLSTYIAKVR